MKRYDPYSKGPQVNYATRDDAGKVTSGHLSPREARYLESRRLKFVEFYFFGQSLNSSTVIVMDIDSDEKMQMGRSSLSALAQKKFSITREHMTRHFN